MSAVDLVVSNETEIHFFTSGVVIVVSKVYGAKGELGISSACVSLLNGRCEDVNQRDEIHCLFISDLC